MNTRNALTHLFTDAQPNRARIMSLFACTRMNVCGNSIRKRKKKNKWKLGLMPTIYDALSIWLQFCDFISILYWVFRMCRFRLCSDFNAVICLLNFIASPTQNAKPMECGFILGDDVSMAHQCFQPEQYHWVVGRKNNDWNVFRIQRFHYMLTVRSSHVCRVVERKRCDRLQIAKIPISCYEIKM